MLKSKMVELEKKLKGLKIRRGLGEIDKETYDLTFAHLNDQIQETSKELNQVIPQISNLDELLKSSIEKLPKLGSIWCSSDLENKRRIQKTLFPEGIFYDAKKHQYLTDKVNEFVHLTTWVTNSYKGNKKANFPLELENSLIVPRRGVEPLIPP